jgi:hypothetical protein
LREDQPQRPQLPSRTCVPIATGDRGGVQRAQLITTVILAALARESALATLSPPPHIGRRMNAAIPDHVQAAEEHQAAIYRAMTPQARMQQAIRMNQNMRRLLAAGFRLRHPEWTEQQVKRAVADRILHARTG